MMVLTEQAVGNMYVYFNVEYIVVTRKPPYSEFLKNSVDGWQANLPPQDRCTSYERTLSSSYSLYLFTFPHNPIKLFCKLEVTHTSVSEKAIFLYKPESPELDML